MYSSKLSEKNVAENGIILSYHDPDILTLMLRCLVLYLLNNFTENNILLAHKSFEVYILGAT